jgi:hypothetical protein
LPASIGRFCLFCVLLAGFAAPSRADFNIKGPTNQTWFVVSPQVGGAYDSYGGPVFGATASFYSMQTGGPGFGIGAYGYGGAFHAEVLAKLSIMGFGGGSVGVALQGRNRGVTGDLWASAAVVGFRYKGTVFRDGTSHALIAFFPLWYLDWK